MVTVSVANQKGGVGKTVTSVSLAVGAALRGLNVLLIDLDPQGNVADSLGLDDGNDLVNLIEKQGKRYVMAREGLSLAVTRSNKRTANLKNLVASMDYKERVLEEALEPVRGIDLVVMDCAPSLDVLHTAALAAADWLLVPSRLDQFAIKGVREILRTMRAVQERGGRVQLAGVLPTFYDRQTKETQAQLENLATAFRSQVWPVIPVDNKVREANRAGRSLWEFDPHCRAVAGVDGYGGYSSALDRLLAVIHLNNVTAGV